MIREHELYHGAALLKLLSRAEQPVEVKAFTASGVKSSYIINGIVDIYIKHSALRMSPWTFTFQPAHGEDLARMAASFENIFLFLVCERDGIAVLTRSEIWTVLNVNSRATQWISVKRGKREQYQVKGSNGSLAFKVADSDFQKVLDVLQTAKQTQGSTVSR
jgi:hypothetical protein